MKLAGSGVSAAMDYLVSQRVPFNR
jgi:hypothetical protein